MRSCASDLKFELLPASKSTPKFYAKWITQSRGKVVWSISIKSSNFGGPWVRIQAPTENMSVFFFCADLFTFFLMKYKRCVHKLCRRFSGMWHFSDFVPFHHILAPRYALLYRKTENGANMWLFLIFLWVGLISKPSKPRKPS